MSERKPLNKVICKICGAYGREKVKGTCARCYDAAYFKANPQKRVRRAEATAAWRRRVGYVSPKRKHAKEKTQFYRVNALYSFPPECLEALKEAQANLCALCGNPPARYNLAIDHDHTTGQVRGLLCAGCNNRLSVLENGDFMERCAKYLDHPPVEKCGIAIPMINTRRRWQWSQIATRPLKAVVESSIKPLKSWRQALAEPLKIVCSCGYSETATQAEAALRLAQHVALHEDHFTLRVESWEGGGGGMR